MPRFGCGSLRLALIVVVPLPYFILVATQTFGRAPPIPQVGMMVQRLNQLFVLRSAIADEGLYQQPKQPSVVSPECIDDLAKHLLFIKVLRNQIGWLFAHVLLPSSKWDFRLLI